MKESSHQHDNLGIVLTWLSEICENYSSLDSSVCVCVFFFFFFFFFPPSLMKIQLFALSLSYI